MSYRPVQGPIVLDLGTFARSLNGDPVPHKMTLTIDPKKLVELAYKAASSMKSRAQTAHGGVVLTMSKIEER